MSWNVECVRCGEMVTTDSPDEIRTDVNDDPVCDDCPYAEEPDYPVTASFTIRRDCHTNSGLIKRALPHLEPYVDDERWMALPDGLTDLGNGTRLTISLTKTDRGNFDSDIVRVDGTPVASELEKQEYECESCGERIQAYAYTNTDALGDYRPLTHMDCPESRSRGQFAPADE